VPEHGQEYGQEYGHNGSDSSTCEKALGRFTNAQLAMSAYGGMGSSVEGDEMVKAPAWEARFEPPARQNMAPWFGHQVWPYWDVDLAAINLDDLRVSEGFQLIWVRDIPPSLAYSLDFVWFGDHRALVFLKDPGTGVRAAYSVWDDEIELFEAFSAGEPLSKGTLAALLGRQALLRSLVQCEVLVLPSLLARKVSYWGDVTSLAQSELQSQGYTKLQELLAPAQLAWIQNYYEHIFEVWGGMQSPPDRYTEGNQLQWNDEPASRYIAHELTPLIERICGRRLVPGMLPLSLWYMEGRGFQMHTDTSPPFDLTLDMVVNHKGICPRYVTFVKRGDADKKRPSLLPSYKTERLQWKIGDAVLFRGAEMYHFGGDLTQDHLHNVFLVTWFYASPPNFDD